MKSVYTGGEKVAEFESYDELRVGDGKSAFIYEGNELVYPNPVKDGLVLWYDFSGRTNTDGQRGVAEDLSGNGNHGTLQNFNFTPESGYDKNKLLFDGVDDFIDSGNSDSINMTEAVTIEVVLNVPESTSLRDIVSKGVTFGGAQNYSMSILNNGRFYFEVNNQGARLFISEPIPPNKTMIIHGVASKSGIKLYSNGKLILKNDVEIANMRTNTNSFKVGGGRFLTGVIHSTKIYNRPLTAEEIAHNYEIEKERFGIE